VMVSGIGLAVRMESKARRRCLLFSKQRVEYQAFDECLNIATTCKLPMLLCVRRPLRRRRA